MTTSWVTPAAATAGFEPRIPFETDTPAGVRALVVAGLGVALLARSAARSAARAPGPPVAVHDLPSVGHQPIGVIDHRNCPYLGQVEAGDRRNHGRVVHNSGRNDLGAFLRSRRERLTPGVAGIAPGVTARRVPGLRREELAELAGVSVGYYTRLEQGVSNSASGAVVDALAAALQLDPAEHEHLRVLAAPRRQPTRPRSRRSKLRQSVRDLLVALSATPAIVIDHRADVLAWNRMGHALLAGHVDIDAPDGRTRPNIARMLFLDAHHRALYCRWQDKAQVTVAALHQAAARYPTDRHLEHLVGQLATDSPEFARMWAQRPVRTCSYYERELDHPVIGRVTLGNETVSLPDDDQQIGLFYARAGTPDADALTLLAHTLDRRVAPETPARKENAR